MARELDPDQQAKLSEFVNRLGEMAGYATTAEWARESGYPASNLSNLRNGKAGVDGFNLVRLVTAAAERVKAEPADLAVGAAVTVADRLAELSGQIERALRALADAQPAAGPRAARAPRRSSAAKRTPSRKKRAAGG